MNKIVRNRALKHLKEQLTGRDNVKLAVVFGSVARNGVSCHDIDVAVKLADQEKRLLALGELVYTISDALDVSEERVDVIDLDQAPIHLLGRILREGIVIKSDVETLKQLYEKVRDYPDLVLEAKKWINLDPEPKVDKMIVEARVAEVRRNTEFLRSEILSRRPEELSYKDVLALERAIHRATEAMLDLCRHLVAVYSLGLAESYGEYPEKLADAGKIPRELADKLSKLAGLKNIIVHRYLDIKLELLYEASREVADEVAKQFMEWIKEVDP